MITITCYRQTMTYPEKDRKKMMDYYLEGILACDGSERDRYTSIFCGLEEGYSTVDDQWNWS